MLHEHGIQLPQKMQQDLVQRRANELVRSSNYQALLSVLNPFEEEGAFVPKEPRLSQMSIDMMSKVATWSKIVFATLVVDWLLLGEPGSKDLLPFSKLALQTLSTVSAVDLEQAVAKEFGDQKLIFRAIIALLTPSWSLDGQASPLCHGCVTPFFFFFFLWGEVGPGGGGFRGPGVCGVCV